ncbi:hypothetical protein SynA1840_00475 [Synechococcus sp. A18-40]|nr:hypothetical protein SynA1840_00475 [Synechococcus sp. A18-40]
MLVFVIFLKLSFLCRFLWPPPPSIVSKVFTVTLPINVFCFFYFPAGFMAFIAFFDSSLSSSFA